MKRIIILCSICIAAWGNMNPLSGQQVEKQDEAILARLYHLYHVLLRPEYMKLSPDEYMKQFQTTEMQAKASMDSLSGDLAIRKAALYNCSGYLISLGSYGKQKEVEGVEMIERELGKRMSSFDPDSPDMDLLSDLEILNLLEIYYNWKLPKTSLLDRATEVLYNVKSEKVRKAYALRNFTIIIQNRGYNILVETVAQDFEVCCADTATIREVRRLKEKYIAITKGKEAFDFEMEDEQGNVHRLSDYKGKFVFLDVWNTLCHVCVEDMPEFIRTAEQYQENNVVFMSLSLDIGPVIWKKLLNKKNFSRSISHYRSTQRAEFVEKYCIYGIPRYILIDPDGKIADAWNMSPKMSGFSGNFKQKVMIK